jgi:hypothetical protein
LRRVEVFCENAYFVLEGDVLGPVRWTRCGVDDGSVEGQDLFDALESASIELRHPDAAFISAIESGTPASP